jgi:hypothetical protein
MRSELVTGALKYVPNRYLLARLAAKAIRGFHRPSTRIAETANQVLFRFSLSDPMARSPKRSTPKATRLRRATVRDSQAVGLGSVHLVYTLRPAESLREVYDDGRILNASTHRSE